ncbi:MAG: GNAT family N-acetyltransferase, partial [Ginsengibacter sp.]
DCDNKDQHCFHLMGRDKNLLMAYSRLVPPGIAFVEASIGRVVTSPAVRRSGIGRELMMASIDNVYKLFGEPSITIGAQLYLKNFYESFGFKKISDIYLEDGIQHIKMQLIKTND